MLFYCNFFFFGKSTALETSKISSPHWHFFISRQRVSADCTFLCPVYTLSSVSPTCLLPTLLSLLLSANLGSLQPTATFIPCLSTPLRAHPHPTHPPRHSASFSLQHLSLIWNEEEMPPCGLSSGPSWGLAEIDACDPAVLIYSPHPRGSGRLHCALPERTGGRQTKRERDSVRVKEGGRETDVMRQMKPRGFPLITPSSCPGPRLSLPRSNCAARDVCDDHPLVFFLSVEKQKVPTHMACNVKVKIITSVPGWGGREETKQCLSHNSDCVLASDTARTCIGWPFPLWQEKQSIAVISASIPTLSSWGHLYSANRDECPKFTLSRH